MSTHITSFLLVCLKQNQIKLMFVNRETIQQDIVGNLPASLCIASEGDPSHDEDIHQHYSVQPNVSCMYKTYTTSN